MLATLAELFCALFGTIGLVPSPDFSCVRAIVESDCLELERGRCRAGGYERPKTG
jgi:hypothetical protein